MQIKFSTAKLIHIISEVVGAALIVLFSINVYMTGETIGEATSYKLEMLKTAFALQQSSEDLTKFAGDYVVTGNTKYKELFMQVSSIRNGVSSRPTLLNSSYWYLPIAVKQEHHPLSSPLSLETIINTLPFTELEMILIQKSHFESQQLELLENKMFKMVETEQKQKALEVYYSDDYYYSKVIIMTSLDKLYASLNTRFEKEITELKSEQMHSLIRLFVIIFLLSISKLMIPTTFNTTNKKKL